MRKLKSNLTQFYGEAAGQIAIMFALLLMPLAVFIGAGIDWSQQITANIKMQSTLDSAALAVARRLSVDKDLSVDEMMAVAQKIIKANTKLSPYVTLEDFSLVYADDLITVAQNGAVKTTFLQLVDISSLNLSVSSQVNMKFGGVDLALAVDLSGSMSGTKLKDLKKATNILLDELVVANVTNMRVSFVPWTRSVNLGIYRDAVAKAATGNGWGYGWYKKNGKWYKGYFFSENTCVRPRDDGAMRPTNTAIDHDRANAHDYTENCPSATLVPLTNLVAEQNGISGRQQLKNIADTWTANGGTGSHNGMYWAWAALHSAFFSAFGTATPDDPQSTKKYAVIMTDGKNNASSFNVKMLATCDAMKAEGILIYTIVLMQDNATINQLFKDCASPDTGDRQFYFKTNSAASLTKDFKTIAQEIGNFYLSK